MNLPKEYISVSQVEMYQRCPKQYWFRYIEELVSPPAVALVSGKSGHTALELNNDHKAVQHEDLPAKEVVDCFNDTFSVESKEIEDWEGETKDNVIKTFDGLLDKYMTETAKTIQPLSSEREFNIEVGVDGQAIKVKGFVDVEQEKSFADYKFVGRTKTQSDTDNSLQLATYKAATDKDGEFICMVKTKTPKIARVTASPDCDWAANVIAEVAKAISAGVFPPCSPASWVCSERFCGYWHKCRGKRG